MSTLLIPQSTWLLTLRHTAWTTHDCSCLSLHHSAGCLQGAHEILQESREPQTGQFPVQNTYYFSCATNTGE